MRIKELSDLAGSTVRTVRYYHQVGLLPVPPTRDGARDYDMSHLARLVRVRWLAQAGVPLAAIAAMLASGPGSALVDLKATVVALDEHLAELQAQRDRMTALIAAVEQDGRLSPLPPVIARFYDRLEEKSDGAARREIRDERDFMELAFYRGDMPAEAALFYQGLAESGLDRSLDAFQAMGERDDNLTEDEMRGIAATAATRLAELPAALKDIDIAVARRAADLYIRLAEPHRRQLGRIIADALLTVIEKGKTS
ncbi:MerR family transcriptional regulator [Actinoplanes sp. NPDC026619]|uniref:MerR family transcriptional regulator n=1 Tax=Actinoplanes sp. NPDC026619 TaxID=3155798 RepID=UPI0033C67680